MKSHLAAFVSPVNLRHVCLNRQSSGALSRARSQRRTRFRSEVREKREQVRRRGARGWWVERGFCSNRTSLQTLTNTLLIIVKWRCEMGGAQVSGAVNRPHQQGPEIKSSHYSRHSHLYDPANIARLTQLFAISKCVIHYKRFLTPI